MHTKMRSLAVAAAVVLGALSASAQTSTLAGKVIGEDGQPLKDAVVKIERTDIKGNYKTKSNKKGEWIHAGLPLGQYNISVEVNGTEKDRINGVRSRLGDPTEIDFDLMKRKKEAEAMQAAVQQGNPEAAKEVARDMSPEQKAAMEKAIKEREKAMAKNKELNDAFNAGMAAMNAQDFATAATSFEKASTLDATQHVVFAQLAEAKLGLAKTATGDAQTKLYDEGFAAYQKAIELKPDDAAYLNNYALALARAKKFEEADVQLSKAATLDPGKAGTYFYNLGAILVNAGQLEPAGKAFEKAIAADPNHADSHYQYGIYLVSKAEMKDGKLQPPAGTKEEFQKYLELKPDGQFAESAKGMLASMDASISTEYVNPDAKKGGKKKK